ncbi:hypothetical protein FPV67DRAFT_254934 [Lyophyllum atratum]|nr:hypothetical protein FPV67DRAFT_254934 [Lyophyllum atratum]
MPSGSSLTPQLEETRACSKCKRDRIPVSDWRKSCAECREKKKIEKARYAQKVKLLAAGVATKGKRKAEDEPDVLQSMKKRFKKSYATGSGTNGLDSAETTSFATAEHDNTEYQSATDMYKAMKVLSKKSHFRGSFSIVTKAEIDHRRRTIIVVDDLRKIAKIPFEHDHAIKPTSGASYRIAFRCTCLAAPTIMKPSPNIGATPMPSSLKRKQSDLTTWVGLKPDVADREARTRCKGKVTIVAEDDASHFLGIKGQKVTVTIGH